MAKRTDTHKDKIEELEDVVYYYSRDKRLERAPQNVRDLYYPRAKKKAGIRSFNPNRSTGALFIAIALVFLFAFSAPRLFREKQGFSLRGNQVSITCRSYQGGAYIALRKIAQGDDFYTGPVNIALSPILEGDQIDSEIPIESWSPFFSLKETEEFGFSAPFESSEIQVVIQAGDQVETLRLTVK